MVLGILGAGLHFVTGGTGKPVEVVLGIQGASLHFVTGGTGKLVVLGI